MHCFMVEFYALLTQYKQYPSVAVSLLVLGKYLFYLLLNDTVLVCSLLLEIVVICTASQTRQLQ